MPHTWAVDPLERTCTELWADEGHSRERASPTFAPVDIPVRELAEVPVFVLLGEPGMGKSKTMEALAAYMDGETITVDNFIVSGAPHQNEAHHVFIDALDEARASGDTTVWRALRQGIAKAQLTRFGVACRAADWQATDKDDLTAVTRGQSVRVFSLNPLTPEQRRAVLESEGVANVEVFEAQAQGLGFADMLGNPQSLKLLVAAVRGHQNQWPENRSNAYELACQELVKEENPRHQQAQRKAALLSNETLLDAAGWLCALMLLSNRNEVSEETPDHDAAGRVWLTDVLDALPRDGFSPDAVQQVLQRPLFTKPRGYSPVHRTVAEYMAARHIAQRIAQGGLLPSRVAALMLASPQHLVSNLRGLAGWLAALSEPMRTAIFEADPAAVLDYGDLHLLPTLAKQALILQLVSHPRARVEGSLWQRAASYVPLVQADMHGFVREWLAQFRETKRPSAQQTMVAHVLLNALAWTPAHSGWEPTLLGLVRDERLTEDIRDSALDALDVHKSSSAVLRALLDDLYQGSLSESGGKLTDHLLQYLYPKHLRPSQVLRYLKPTHVRTRGHADFSMFWQYHIEEQTPPELLPELMAALEQAMSKGAFKDEAFDAPSHDLEGLESLVVTAIEMFGASIPVSQLSRWLLLCSNSEVSAFKSPSQRNAQRLGEWLRAHAEVIKPVLTHWVQEGASSWEAQHRVPGGLFPPGMGAFWLAQAQEFQAHNEAVKAKDCLATAVWWTDHPDSGITLDDLVAAGERDSTLKEALAPLLVSALDDNNWRRKHWQQNQKYREKAAAREELNENNRRYLLEHLDEVRSGKLLRYLNEAAWTDLKDSGYSGGNDSQLIEQWRKEHPELDEATRQGYLALLHQLTSEQAINAINSRKNNSIWHFELPCLVAVQQLYAQDPQQLLQLGKERLQALVTLFFLHDVSNSDWLLALVDERPEWVEEVWWSLSAQALRSKTQIRVPHLWLLVREPRTRRLAVSLLPRLLASWPAKFSELNFAEFAQLLEATLRTCPPTVVGELVAQRLRKKSLSSLQRSYLVMTGLWVDHAVFSPMVDTLLHRKQIVQSELLGFIGHLNRYGGKAEALPSWDATTMGMLFRLFGPLCPSAYPRGTYSPDAKDAGRGFLYQLLGELRSDTSEAAQRELQQLLVGPTLSEWKTPLEDALARQTQARAEKAFALPAARQVALTLQNKTPANPADLMAVGLAALEELQRELRNSPTNLINRFWSVDSAGKRPIPPHRPEPECRNVIAEWLVGQLNPMGISVDPEHQHGGQNQSDIVLRVQTTGHDNMLLPLEVKGDWNKDLWTAPYEQLAKQYASDPLCHGRGIYLVLWLGAYRGDARRPKQHPNYPTATAAELRARLQQETDRVTKGMDIKVFVLDVSINRPGN